jgi:ATP-dependent Clp protease ATP-binding subunit ClpX
MIIDKKPNYFFISFINSDLYPKQEFKDVPVIQVTEHFAQNLFLAHIINIPKPAPSLIQIRQILFGLGSSSFTKEKIKEIIDFIPEKKPQEITLLIGELKLEWKKQNSIIESQVEDLKKDKFLVIEKWSNILQTYYPELFKDTINLLSVAPDELKNKPEIEIFDSPLKIKSRLEEYYVGPEEVKMTLSRVFYEHSLSINLTGKQILPKRNLLLVGPSGSGKSYIIQKLAEISRIPFLIYDSSRFTQRGIVGDKIEDVLRFLFHKAKSLEKMKGGIIFFDEVDKLAKGTFTSDNDVSTIGPQQDLLKFIEGDDYEFSSSDDRYAKKDLKFNSSKLLVIAGGAFEGIEDLIKKRKKQFGFGINDRQEYFDSITIEDLTNFGMIKQLAARFQIISILQQKTIEHLVDILQNVKDSLLNVYINYFRFHGCELSFTENGVREIAKLAFDQNIGARGLVKIIEQILPMYDLGNKSITNLVVDENYINTFLKKCHLKL